MNTNKKWIPLLLGSIILTSAGCSADGGDKAPSTSAAATETKPEPVTVSVFQQGANITDEEFQAIVAEPVKKKYPHITVELVRADKDKTPQNLVASGALPDLVFTESLGLNTFKDLKAIQDLTSLLKENNFDLNRLEPFAVETIKAFGEKGEFYAIPLSVNFSATFYNKDLFDKFGVPYPKDGQTWEEMTELGKRLTRVENGQQYYGFYPGGLNLMAGEASLPYYDPKTQKATLTGDGWARVFQTYKAVWDIPGNQVTGNNITTFNRDRTIAMMADFGARLGELETLHNQGNPMNWDLTTFPVFKDNPKTVAETQLHMLLLSSASKNKNAAMKVLEVVTSDETQLEMNKRGRKTVLKDPKMKESFGANLNSLKGKNVNAIFYGTPAVLRYTDKYAVIARGQLLPSITKITQEGRDINTVLRETEELANKKIEEALRQ
ncbi:extracellular solute-binding protein [Paenibacillus hemerocallicola]|uniref:Extracellular solute-binding protein n=1 Tax=Paenibacillus hemerocallicola TaxID=1172614 RepID=A0A5C4TDA0_9BACL|nr:extracellular solute-binding protein [Paenibacillus hemerocallicola]TNJ66981.1 extracellular solute-binding protein [Paenibacillus hemerocallicola]